nr:hypothetical protein [uncultured Sphaerochaeta sp.]
MKDTWPVKDGRTCTRSGGRPGTLEARNVEDGQGGAERVWDV